MSVYDVDFGDRRHLRAVIMHLQRSFMSLHPALHLSTE
jgi:hypothetical protein